MKTRKKLFDYVQNDLINNNSIRKKLKYFFIVYLTNCLLCSFFISGQNMREYRESFQFSIVAFFITYLVVYLFSYKTNPYKTVENFLSFQRRWVTLNIVISLVMRFLLELGASV